VGEISLPFLYQCDICNFNVITKALGILMLIFFENDQDLSLMIEMVKAYEKKRTDERRCDDLMTHNILEAIKKEIRLQKYTRAGYLTKHVRCHQCKNVWLALYDDANSSITCPTCNSRIPVSREKKNKEK